MRPRVLVVDDDESIRSIITMSLEVLASWEVVAVDNGEAGLAAARAGSFDAVLLDIMMPGIDGLRTFALLQEDPVTHSLPVVLLTAKAQVGPVQVWDGLAVQGVIAKPFSAPDLASQLADLLGWELP